MRERPEDTGIAVGLALGLHLLAVLLMYLGWRFGPSPQALSVAGRPIEVDLVQTMPLNQRPPPATERPSALEAAPPPQPEPEPAPQDALIEPQPAPQAPAAVPDVREQERARRDVVSPEPPVDREQEERHRQEQIDLTERDRQVAAEERQRRAAQQLERLRQLAALREQREQLDQQTRREEQRIEQQRDLAARPVPAVEPPVASGDAQGALMAGNNGTDTSLLAAYQLAIQNAIERNWRRPETIPVGQSCVIHIRQIPVGSVIAADVDPGCPYDTSGRDSLERAVLAASPLPYAGFEPVFRPRLILRFIPEDR